MGQESQGYMPPKPEEGDGSEGNVFRFPTGKSEKPTEKPAEQQIRDEVHARIQDGDYAVPEFVTDTKGKKPYFEADPGTEFQAAEDKKMKKSVDEGWEDVQPRDFNV